MLDYCKECGGTGAFNRCPEDRFKLLCVSCAGNGYHMFGNPDERTGPQRTQKQRPVEPLTGFPRRVGIWSFRVAVAMALYGFFVEHQMSPTVERVGVSFLIFCLIFFPGMIFATTLQHPLRNGFIMAMIALLDYQFLDLSITKGIYGVVLRAIS